MQLVQISKWGNSLGFRIPRGLADSMDIRAGDSLELIPSDNGLLVKKAGLREKRYALADILDSFASSAQRPLEDFGGPRGEELW